jgi:RNA polymerase sigma-70 factor (ECF subfamily)
MARKPLADPDLAAQPRSGRAAAFEAAVLLHLGAAYTLARYLTRRADTAEDIVQEALLRAYRSFEDQRVENLRAWLLAIVRNCFLTWNARAPAGRDGGSERQQLQESQEAGQEPDTPESILIQQEESSAIRALIEGLPHLFREVLVLRDIEDMSYREIAEITGVPIGTVMSRLARARKMFAAAWKGSERSASKETLP